MAGAMRRMGIYLGLVEDDDARGYGRYDARQAEHPEHDRRYGGRYADDRYDGHYDDEYSANYVEDELEADDLLGSLAAVEAEAGGHALILTADRDMFQCVGDRVTVLLQRARQEGPDEVDADGVRERYGIAPAQVPDFIALRGDPSDGLPGAKGIGEKTAADLLRRHGTLEAAIEGAIREKPGVRKALLADPDLLLKFKDIATLRDVSVKLPPDRPLDTEAAAAAARELGMNRLAERLERWPD